MRVLLASLGTLLRAALRSRATLALENAALRQQLAAYQRAEKRPRLQPGDRLFWVLLRRCWSDWTRSLVVVKPATVVGWHRRGFRALWRQKSNPGRPRIPKRHIAVIKRISGEHPEWGEDKIAEELAVKLGIHLTMAEFPDMPRGSEKGSSSAPLCSLEH
jgi:hypothetical protein